VLGPEGAAQFQRRLTLRAAKAAAEAGHRRGLALEIRHQGGSAMLLRDWLGEHFHFRPQGVGDIGRRMQASLGEAFAEGSPVAVLIGSDIPGLTSATLLRAFEALRHHDLVFGPAADGGYYLIGMTAAGFRHAGPCFEPGIAWGASDVLARTLSRVRDARLACRLLETLADVDRPQDLPAAMQALCREKDGPGLSVVIPALNEADQIEKTLSTLARARDVEVLLVDGGSTDATVAVAQAAGIRVLAARPPRSVQMNAGAAAAGGDRLLFLHADTDLPAGFESQVRRTLARPGVAAGAFRLRIDGRGRGLRIVERAANWRSRWFQMPYGDQALFMGRDLFWELGGFPPIPIMEDFELVRRLKRRGRIALAPGCAATSARRWLRLGAVKTWLINQWVIAAHFAGVSPHRLAAWYRGKKS
jgi:rSAM/selenodomain-associated transferase 2/rSAM/selenodomain-associated transferase 1